MDWLLRMMGKHRGAVAVPFAFPFVLWAEVSDFPLTRNRQNKD